MRIDNVGGNVAVRTERAASEDSWVDSGFTSVLQQAQAKVDAAIVRQPEQAQDQVEQTGRNVVDEFMAWVQMSPAEKMRDRILKEMGLTEEQLAEMDLEERAKVEALIAQKIRE